MTRGEIAVGASDNHRRARSFAEEVARLPGVELDARGIETNIVFVTTRGDARVAEGALRERHVLAIALDPRRVRFVFHRDAGDDALEAAVAACRAVFG